MEIYILDSLFRREKVVDVFKSFIWTERFASYGDFELDIHSNQESRSKFVVGARIAINQSYRVMTVETVENTTNSDGEKILKVSGRSLEAILEDRVARRTLASLDADPSRYLPETF